MATYSLNINTLNNYALMQDDNYEQQLKNFNETILRDATLYIRLEKMYLDFLMNEAEFQSVHRRLENENKKSELLLTRYAVSRGEIPVFTRTDIEILFDLYQQINTQTFAQNSFTQRVNNYRRAEHSLLTFFLKTTAAIILYPLRKTTKSLLNIFAGKKIVRSAARIMAFFGGLFIGVLKGAAIGGTAGSVVPFVGSLVGATIGGFLGATFSILSTKIIIKSITSIASLLGGFGSPQHLVSISNPKKYALTQIQKDGLGVVNTAKINLMMLRLREQKSELLSCMDYLPQSVPATKRREFNRLVQEIKSNPVTVLYRSGNDNLLWNEQNSSWKFRNEPEPQDVLDLIHPIRMVNLR